MSCLIYLYFVRKYVTKTQISLEAAGIGLFTPGNQRGVFLIRFDFPANCPTSTDRRTGARPMQML